jgi:ATP-dependent protease ClpP protease subunit
MSITSEVFVLKILLGFFLFVSTMASAEKIELKASNTVGFNDVVEEHSTTEALVKIAELDSTLPEGEPIYLVLNTPGGEIVWGLEFIEFLENQKRPIHTITLFSASMGFHIVQSFGKRYVVESGVLMSHRARGGFAGQFPGEADSRMNHWLKRTKRMDQIAAKRAGKSYQEYRELVQNEYWCEGQGCVDDGFADATVKVSCDSSLNGYTVKTKKQVFMGHLILFKATYSKCPMKTGLVDWDVVVDGQSFTNPTADAVGVPKLNLSPTELVNINSFIEEQHNNAKHQFEHIKGQK